MNSEIGYGFQLVPLATAFGLKTFIRTYSNIGLFYDTLPWMTLYRPKEPVMSFYREFSQHEDVMH